MYQAFNRNTLPNEYRSQFLGNDYDTEDRHVDKETLRAVAGLMGVSVEHIETEINNKIAEQERIHRIAFKKKRKRKDQIASGITHFIEVVEFHGKQLFWSMGGQEFVVNANGKIFSERKLDRALHRLACE